MRDDEREHVGPDRPGELVDAVRAIVHVWLGVALGAAGCKQASSDEAAGSAVAPAPAPAPKIVPAPPPTPAPAPPAPIDNAAALTSIRCSAAVTRVMSLEHDDIKKKSGAGDDMLADLMATSKRRCAEDDWSAAAVTCYTNSTTRAASDKCNELLTGAQLAKLTAAIDEVYDLKAGDDRGCTMAIRQALPLETAGRHLSRAALTALEKLEIIRCRGDHWPPSAVHCMTSASTAAELDACPDLVPAQSAALQDDLAGAIQRGEVPPDPLDECAKYRLVMKRVERCASVPEATKAMLRLNYKQTARVLANRDKMNPDAIDALQNQCRTSALHIATSTLDGCGP